jgi:hypothetical protein
MQTAKTLWRQRNPDLGVLADRVSFDSLKRMQLARITRAEACRRLRAGIEIKEITEPERDALRRALADRKEI